MNKAYRKCPKCEKLLSEEMYIPMSNSSKYSINGRSSLCIECIASNIDRKDLSTIDKMCQYLDIPFDANKWIEMEKKTEKLGPLLLNYSEECLNGKYVDNDWYLINKMWEKARKYNSVIDNLTSLHSDLLLYLRKKWGHIEDFTLEDYLRMEEYERHTLNHYNFQDEARKDMIRKLAKLSVLSDVAISKGNTKDATNLLQSYNNIMKESGIRSELASDENTINTLSELTAYLEKQGFVLNYKITENRDIVDKTIENMQQYTKRLFTDSSETLQEMYGNKTLAASSGTEINDEELELLYDTTDGQDVELEETMNEEELESMFREVENEYSNK